MDDRALQTEQSPDASEALGGIECPVERAIRLIGGKWRMLILRTLIADGAQRFNRLAQSIDGISHKVLTQNLRELVGSGLVAQDEASAYGVTPSGMRLQPVLHGLGQWMESHEAD